MCPGRFFAISEIKLVLIAILRKYRMRTEDGEVPQHIYNAVTVDRKPTKVRFESRE